MLIDILIYISLSLLAFYVIFLIEILRGLGKLNYPASEKTIKECVTIIIPFRNESDNILSSLSSVSQLDYPGDKLEIIYINDDSTDDSLAKLSEAAANSSIKILSVKNDGQKRAFKKKALLHAIESSHGDIIVTTDADCLHNRKWLSSLISAFDEDTGMVAGPVDFKNSNTFFEKFQQLEFKGLITAGAGLIGAGSPVICSGANLAYRKKTFYDVNGFEGNTNLTSGDDELLMQKIKRNGKYKIKFCADFNAVVKTAAIKNIPDFFHQRKRWASKALFYKNKALILKLLMIFLFYLSIPVLLVLSFVNQIYFILIIINLSVKFFIEYLILQKADKIIFRSGIKYFLITEMLQIPYIIIAAVSGVFGNYIWKQRAIKR